MTERASLEEVARKWISLWCVPVDWELFDRLHAEELHDHSSAGRPATKEGFREGLALLVQAFPDLHTTVEDMIVDDEASKVSVRWSARGTNRNEFLGVGPTGRSTSISGIEIIEVKNGMILARWGEWDVSDHRDSADPA